MEILQIKGTDTTINFVYEDGSYIKGDGERLANGFNVYKDSLRTVVEGQEAKLTEKNREQILNDIRLFIEISGFKLNYL